jgi:hypothetical protein
MYSYVKNLVQITMCHNIYVQWSLLDRYRCAVLLSCLTQIYRLICAEQKTVYPIPHTQQFCFTVQRHWGAFHNNIKTNIQYNIHHFTQQDNLVVPTPKTEQQNHGTSNIHNTCSVTPAVLNERQLTVQHEHHTGKHDTYRSSQKCQSMALTHKMLQSSVSCINQPIKTPSTETMHVQSNWNTIIMQVFKSTTLSYVFRMENNLACFPNPH